MLGRATAVVALSLLVAADEPVPCGRNGDPQVFPGGITHGPAISQDGGQEAINAVLAEMFDLSCGGPCEEVEGFTVSGCDQSYGWRNNNGPLEVADQLPNVTPPTWIANLTTDPDGNVGWVTCSNCVYVEKGEL
jgi:hypothetical protein